MHLGPSTEATFVAGRHGRDGELLLWDEESAEARSSTATLVFPDGHRPVPVDRVPLRDAIPDLVRLPADDSVRPSLRAWSVATRLALEAISRGRLLPTIAADGTDTWRVGPLDLADRARFHELALALPAAAHAVAHPAAPDRIVSAGEAAMTFVDAVADAFVRTAGGALVAGSDAFAGCDPVDVTAVESWLGSTVAGTASDTAPGLRMELAADPADAVRCVLQVQSRLDPSLVMDAVDVWRAPPAVAQRFGADVEADVLLALRAAARVWPPIGRLLEESAPEELVLEDAEVEELFGPVADDLAAAGLPVLWPADVLRPVEIRPVIGEATTPPPGQNERDGEGRPGLDVGTLGEMRWHAVLAGAELTEAELLQLSEAKRPIVRLRDGWVRADPEQLRRLNERTPLQAGDVVAAALSGTITIGGRTIDAEIVGGLATLADRLRTFDPARSLPAPDGLVAELRPYQERGLAWLVEMAELGLGGVLADDMGLGKTIQVLALHQHRRGSGPMLVVCPASVLGNWQREAERFIPGIPVRRYHGNQRNLDDLADDEIVVATYGIVRRDVENIAARRWDLVIADEAQAVKNPTSKAAASLRRIPATVRVALTGTPVENRLADLWALLDWTTPGLLGTLGGFQRTLATPIERDRDAEATERLATLVRPFLLRRRKSDPEIVPDLPPKTETDRFVGLTIEQATLYKAVCDELLAEATGAEGIERKGRILKLLTALKQICNHPAQYLAQEAPIAGRSVKFDAVTELVETILDEGDSVLVFTQYVAMGHLLTRHLGGLGLRTQFLHGGTPIPVRETMVDTFQHGDPMAFVISLKAGGTGLNLTRATQVIHVDRWWNPAVEDQASDRAWRIGQDRPVQVHRMVCEGTLEERIARLLEHKRDLAESVVGGGESWVSELTDDELADLVLLADELDGAA